MKFWWQLFLKIDRGCERSEVDDVQSKKLVKKLLGQQTSPNGFGWISNCKAFGFLIWGSI